MPLPKSGKGKGNSDALVKYREYPLVFHDGICDFLIITNLYFYVTHCADAKLKKGSKSLHNEMKDSSCYTGFGSQSILYLLKWSRFKSNSFRNSIPFTYTYSEKEYESKLASQYLNHVSLRI